VIFKVRHTKRRSLPQELRYRLRSHHQPDAGISPRRCNLHMLTLESTRKFEIAEVHSTIYAGSLWFPTPRDSFRKTLTI
jgi:hypothetical protein